MASTVQGPHLCMLTTVGGEIDALVLLFGLGKADTVEFRTARLPTLVGPLSTLEDDVVFEPGEGADKLRLMAGMKKPFPSGALLRLGNGDMGVGFAERLNGQLLVISLSTGDEHDSFDLVFDRWSLSLRRGDRHALVGHFKGGGWRD